MWAPTPRTARRLASLVGAAAALALAPAFSAPARGASGPGGHASKHAGSHESSSAALLTGVNVVNVDADPLSVADRAIAQAHALHAKVVRTDVPWATLEPNGPGAIEPKSLAFMDRMVSDAAADGMRVIMLVDRTPCWVSSAPSTVLASCRPSQDSEANDWPPVNPASYGELVALLAKRYGSHLAAIEIWNEPDQVNEHYFAGTEKAKRYAALLKVAYTAIKGADPSVPVIAGSLVGSNGAFLDELYSDGIEGYYDGLAVHYYTLTLAAVRAIHEVQLAHGDTKPLWLDEFGWSSCWPHEKTQQEQGCVTSAIQAANLSSVFHELTSATYVAAAISYKLQDTAGEDFGVLTRSGAHKPAFKALARVLASPLGAPQPLTAKLHATATRVVATGSGPVGDVMELEAFKGAARYRELFTLDRFNRFSLPLPRALGTHGVSVRVYQRWLGPGKAADASI